MWRGLGYRHEKDSKKFTPTNERIIRCSRDKRIFQLCRLYSTQLFFFFFLSNAYTAITQISVCLNPLTKERKYINKFIEYHHWVSSYYPRTILSLQTEFGGKNYIFIEQSIFQQNIFSATIYILFCKLTTIVDFN